MRDLNKIVRHRHFKHRTRSHYYNCLIFYYLNGTLYADFIDHHTPLCHFSEAENHFFFFKKYALQ